MSDHPMESLEEFRSRARAWIVTNLRPLSAATGESDMRTEHALQIKLAEGGFAGIAIPKEYGGAGLTLDHQRVWAEEIRGYETPMSYCVSIGMMLPTIMDHGSEALKARHIPRMLRGDETFIQLLSEPGGGSDMAGAQTRATRKGDGYVISGSKMWSSGADSATYGICLARVNWDAQKHQGLGMFVVPLKDKAVTITPIVPANGGKVRQFIEYLDDVVVPDEYVLGHEGQGWVVAQRLLFHERNATVGLGYGYGLGGSEGGRLSKEVDTTYVARRSGAINDPAFASTIADNHIALVVAEQLSERLGEGMRRGKLVGGWGSLSKLGLGVDTPLSAEAALAVAGAEGVVWTGQGPAPEVAMSWLVSRGISIAGGSNEMQRNIISERLMGLPKDPGDQNTAPFSELMKRRSS